MIKRFPSVTALITACAALVFGIGGEADAATFTATAAAGSAVTMDDPTGSVTFTVTNTTVGPARQIDRVRFYFTRTQYFIARGTTAPANWSVSAISNPAAGAESYVEFRANNAAARIAPGRSLVFSVMLQGTSYQNLLRSAADAIDANTRVRSRDNTGLWTNQTGAAPSWARKSLALTFQPAPTSLGPGQTLGLTAQIENRSTAVQAASSVANPSGGCGTSPNPPCPAYTGSASLLLSSGPTPASLNLAAGRQGTIDWTYTAGSGTGTVYFRGQARNGAAATSIDAASPTVTIATLSAVLSLDPASVISGGDTTVRLDVTNSGIATTLTSAIDASVTTIPVADTSSFPPSAAGVLLYVESEQIACTGKTAASFTGCTRGANGTTAAVHSSGTVARAGVSLGSVTPAITAPGGSTLLSGATPTSISSLPVGSTGSFVWRYRITGATGSTFTFQASASAASPASITSNTATASGSIGSLVVTTSPSTVASGTAPLALGFTLSNRTGAALRSVCMYQPNATFTAAYTSASAACGSWTVAPFGGARPGIRFTANTVPSRIANGNSCVFTVNYSSAPAVTKDTDYVFQFDGLSGTNCSAGYRGTAYGRLTVTEYGLALSAFPASVPADGASAVAVTALLTQGGAPTANKVVVFSATAGRLSASAVATNLAGQAVVALTAPSSATATSAILTATYLKARATITVPFSAFSGPNLQYVGGTLSPSVAPKGSTCPNYTFTVQVQNAGTVNTTLNSNTFFTFTDGTNVFTAYLNSSTIVNAGATASLSFGSPTFAGGGGGVALSPSFVNGSYAPSMSFYGTGIASPPQVRPVTDSVTVAGSCGGGAIKLLDWREIVR